MNILELVENVKDLEGWDKIKTSNVKTCARRFAMFLGCEDPTDCDESIYNIPENDRNQEIKIGSKDMSIKNPTIKNTRSQLKMLFESAYKHNLLKRPEVSKLNQVFFMKRGLNSPRITTHKTALEKEPYALPYKSWNSSLKEQFITYKQWATAEYEETRDRKKVRPITVEARKGILECYFGYLFNVEKYDKDSIRMDVIGNIDMINKYVKWHINIRMESRVSRQIIRSLENFHYFLVHYPPTRNKESGIEISNIIKKLDKPEPIIDKRTRLVMFEDLMSCGVSEFPIKNQYNPQIKKHVKKSGSYLAYRAGRGVAIMLLATATLRSQNWRQAQIGTHIFKDKETGKWILRFSGRDSLAQLKKEYDKSGNLNTVYREVHHFIVPFLEEYLSFWRPIIINSNQVKSENLNYLFLNTKGKPFSRSEFSRWIQVATLRWLGKRINPHSFRHAIASQDLIENGNIEHTAELLNDEPDSVYKHYYLPDKNKIIKKIYSWMDSKLNSFDKRKKKKNDENEN